MDYANSPAASRLIVLVLLCSGLLACGGTRILDQPVPLTIGQPQASSSNEDMTVSLDWIIVRDGPGTWARNADWDEYLVRFLNRSTSVLTITSVAAYDSTFTRQETNGRRNELVNASRLTAKRYASQGVEIKAGIGSGALLAAGAIGGAIAVEAGVAAALYMSSTAAAVTLGALVAAPVLVTGGIVKSVRTRKVSNEIMNRQADLPLILAPGEEQVTHLFFPLTPSPQNVEVIYRVDTETGARVLELDTSAALDGLHIMPNPAGG